MERGGRNQITTLGPDLSLEIPQPIDLVKGLLRDQIIEISEIDADENALLSERMEGIRHFIGEMIPDRATQVDSLLAITLDLLEQKKLGELIEKNGLEAFITVNLETKQERLVRLANNLAGKLELDPQKTEILVCFLGNDLQICDEQGDDLVEVFSGLKEKLVTSEPESLEVFASLAAAIYPRLRQNHQKLLDKVVYESVNRANTDSHRIAVGVWANWLIETQGSGVQGELTPGDEIHIRDIHKLRFLDTFFGLMTPVEFDAFGKFLLNTTSGSEDKQTLESLLKNYSGRLDPCLQDLPISVLNAMAETYIEAGIMAKSATGILRQTVRTDESSLTYNRLNQVARAQKRIDKINAIYENGRIVIKSLEDIKHAYDEYNQTKAMTKLPIQIDGESLRTLHIAGIGLGHQDTAVDFIANLIKRIKSLPDDKKPQVIVLNNLIAGAFENRQKNLKPALVDGFRTMEEQFNAGRVVLDSLQSLNIPIYLNLGSPDWEIARDIVLRMLRYQFQLVGHIAYYEQDELQRLQEWSKYDKFVVDVALPYCLRKGEVLSAGDLLTLLDVYDKIVEANALGIEPDILDDERAVIDIGSIPLPGKVNFGDNLFILDNAALTLGNNDYSRRAVYFGDFNFSTSSQPPLYQEPMKSLAARVVQELATGKVSPGSSYTLLNQHEFIALALDGYGTWVESMPGVQNDTFLTNKASRTRQADGSRRQATTRRRVATVETPLVETKPYRRLYHFMSDELMDLADSADRTTIIVNGDEQTGSVTARLDLMVKAHDIAIQKLQDNKVIWTHFGDEPQGNNYKEKLMQEKAVGMQASVDDQVMLFNMILALEFNHVSESHFKNIIDGIMFPGNHQLNSGFGRYGITHMDSLAQTWNEIARQKHSPLRTRVSSNVVTSDGSFYQGWIGNIQVGGYKGIAQHYPLKKGGKGMGGLPVYQTWPLLESFVENAAGVSFFHFQHYHQSSIHLVAGKIATIGPSKAGQSEFEHYLGHRSTPGMMMYHLGGGLPPTVEFLSPQALLNHQINDESHFSDRNLKDLGFATDEGFNPMRDGFIPWVTPFSAETLLAGMPAKHPQSALQKYLWWLATTIPLQAHTVIG